MAEKVSPMKVQTRSVHLLSDSGWGEGYPRWDSRLFYAR